MQPNKRMIIAAIQAGELDSAAKLVDSWLELNPQDIEAQYYRGLVLLERGELSDSITWLQRAQKSEPGNVLYNCNLGCALHRDGQLEEAAVSLENALAVDGEHEISLFNLGCVQLELDKDESALETFTELTSKSPNRAAYLCAKGDAHRKLNQWGRAVRHYKLALQVDPNLVSAHVNLAPIELHLGHDKLAIEHCQKALELDPENTIALKNYGDCLVYSEDLEKAMDIYADAFELSPDSIELCLAIAGVWLEVSNLYEAGFWFQKASQIDAENIEAKAGVAHILKEQGDAKQAIELLEPLIEEDPDNVNIRMAIGDALWDEGDAAAAIEHINVVIEKLPKRVATRAKLGQLLSSSGDVDAAINEYQTALKQNPGCIPALSGLASTQRAKMDVKHVRQMERLLTSEKIKEGMKSSLHSGLAFYYDGIKEPEAEIKAAENMLQSNISQWSYKSQRGWEYENSKQEDHISQIIEHFNADFLEKTKGWGNQDETPVFIVGMPRSGTTLTEQILARHHKVLGIGERNLASQSFAAALGDSETNNLDSLQALEDEDIELLGREYIEQLEILKQKEGSLEALRVVDKMPDNYALLGWIAALLPNAKIIHCNRDPRDVALSCWMTQFGAIQWACQPDHIVQRIKQYRRVMSHWRKVLPGRFIEINYEDLVANQEAESKRLIEWIGMDWDENCLKFYESDRLVRTASITQVRQPIYTRSVARWKRYEQLIPELFEPITEMIGE